MSLYIATSSLFSLNPKVWLERGVLCSRTNLLFQVLSLFFWERSVRVDRNAKALTIRRRYLWLLESEQTVQFDEISHFNYRYASTSLGWNRFGEDRNRAEAFSIEAELHRGGDPVVIETFRGECAVPTGAVDMMLGGDVVGNRGTQEGTSLGYLDLIQVWTGRGLSRGAKPAVHGIV